MSSPNPPSKTIYFNGIIVGEVLATGDRDKDVEVMRQFLNDSGTLSPDRLAQGAPQRVESRTIRGELCILY